MQTVLDCVDEGDRAPIGGHIDAHHLVVSFDLDGTVWFGDPPGPIVSALVDLLVAKSAVFGSASDRTALDQRRLWARHEFEPAFVVTKHHLHTLPALFPGRVLVHIGDRFADQLEAKRASALFVDVAALPKEPAQQLAHLIDVARAAGDRSLAR